MGFNMVFKGLNFTALNTRNDLKGRRGETSWVGHEDWVKTPYDKG
jgi:hypothetical protein